MIILDDEEDAFVSCYVDKLTPRQRLAHKLRDGKYRAKKMGCFAAHVRVEDVPALFNETSCYYCKKRLGPLYALEHKIPLKLGGPHIGWNLAKACPRCNQEKHIQTELDYLARLDRMS